MAGEVSNKELMELVQKLKAKVDVLEAQTVGGVRRSYRKVPDADGVLKNLKIPENEMPVVGCVYGYRVKDKWVMRRRPNGKPSSIPEKIAISAIDDPRTYVAGRGPKYITLVTVHNKVDNLDKEYWSQNVSTLPIQRWKAMLEKGLVLMEGEVVEEVV